jgi:hypothetical protein
MRYWIQEQAPNGNYFDSVGLEGLAKAKQHARYLAGQGRACRIIQRVDEVIESYGPERDRCRTRAEYLKGVREKRNKRQRALMNPERQ